MIKMVKKFVFRGKSLEELKAMDIKEFAKLLKAKERRSVLRMNDEQKKFLARIPKKLQKNKPIKTHLREMVILPQLVGLTIKVHNGKEFVEVEIQPGMVGHRLGEFSPTRRRVKHSTPGLGATRSSVFTSAK